IGAMLAAQSRAVADPSYSLPPRDSSFAWKQIAEPIEPFLQKVGERLTEQVDEFEPEIAELAQYAISAQGKQIRPILVALSADTAGPIEDAHVTLAVIIEMVHLATLVHDDVMDHAKMRRGRPTLAENSGSHLSVLLGDCLFAHALKLAADFPTPDICRAVATATNTVCSGEILQTQHRWNFDLDREDYLRMLAMKTAELFALSCELGGCRGSNGSARAGLRQYGLSLGTAYQIYDDCLDLFGVESAAGKSLGTDLANGKLTLPALIVLERGSVADRTRLQELIQDWNPLSLL